MESADQVIAQIAAKLGSSVNQMRKKIDLDPFTYNINFLPLAASNNATDQFITQADSGFAIVKHLFRDHPMWTCLSPTFRIRWKYAPLLVTLSDSGAGRNLSNSRLQSTACRNWRTALYLARPKVLDPNSTFVAQVQNLVATAFNVRLAFQGFKIFGDVSGFRASR